jgi:gliding motility-associated-like protein
MRPSVYLIAILFASIIKSQTLPPHYSHVPSNAGVNNLFFNGGTCSKFQFIYTQAEIAAMVAPVNATLSIDTLWFRHGGGGGPFTQLSNFVVRMGHTSLSNPGAQFNANFNLGAPQTVLNSASYTYTPLIGAAGQPDNNWSFIPLQTPFQYNYTDNLCIEFSFSASSGFIAGNYANTVGTPVTQYASSNSASSADGTTSRPMLGISGLGGGINCNPNGNWFLISNYDGGNLSIIVDQDIPDLKIGICTYEPVNVTFSGPFVANISEVRYAGFNSAQNNNNCGFPISTSTFNGISAGLVTLEVSPPVNIISPPNPNNILNQPNGYNFGVICLASCDLNAYQGGCNTADQVIDYFQTQFGGSLRGAAVQYCCWSNETPYRVSQLSGNCCGNPNDGEATVTYPPGPFCTGDGTVSPVLSGDNSGTFYSVPVGLNINPATGIIDLASSTPGDYEIVYARQVNCNELLITSNLTLNSGTSEPPAFSLTNPICVTSLEQTPQPLSGFVPGGTFSASPAGLSIDASNGTINPGNSLPGQYAVSYTISASACGTAQTFTFPNLVIEPEQDPYPLILGDTCIASPLTVQLGGTIGVQSIQWNMGDPNGGASNQSNSPIHNHQYSQAGTYTITAIVQYGCGSDSITRVVEVIEAVTPQLSFAYPSEPCRLSNTAPVLSSGFALGGVFSASPPLPINIANGTLGSLGNTEGLFVITYTYTGDNCVAAGTFSDTIAVQAFSQSLIAQPESVTLILGDTVELEASGTISYTWSPDEGLSCSNCPSPLAFPTQTTQYLVSGIDASGCLSIDTVLVFVDIICNEVFIPSVFSPNGKGPQSNETFCVFSDCVAQFKMVIHNRWGQQVFETEDINQCWDGNFKGSEASSGVYAYNVYLRQLDGTVLSKTGSLVLVK